ncbi:MAG: ParB/RepB/Spo0J family partition protein [Anaerolineae bacterium]|nr:ParB/RepB/Spo0J family partition protein [Anaerolineae bacterium]
MAKKSDTPNRINSLLQDVGQMMILNADPAERLQDTHLRVENLPIQLVRPDPAQPRRVLPETIYQAFHQQHLTPYQALKELVQLVQIAARQKGRPFTHILDLLPNPNDESETDTPVTLTPEEILLRDLVNLAVTIRDDGQVNPLTVVDKSEGMTHIYQIETGERRYWATWLMMEFLPGYQGDGSIPCIIVPSNRASVFRQAKENTSRAGLNAIAMARQAALLVLAAHQIRPPDGPVSNDYYRQALELDLRSKREYSADILSAMGGLSRARFSRIKALIGLSDEAIEIADRHDLDEARLRYVLALPEDQQAEMVRQIIEYGLTRKQVEEMCLMDDESDKSEETVLPSEIRRTVKLLRLTVNVDPYETAKALFEAEGDIYTARIHLQKLRAFIDEVDKRLLGQ